MTSRHFKKSHLADYESLDSLLQESVEKTNISLNVRLSGYMSCLDAYKQNRVFLRIASLRLGSGETKFLNQISPTWFPFILRSLMGVARFLISGYILNLYQKISRLHATGIEFYGRVSII